MNYTESFTDFIYWYTGLVDENNRKKYFREIASYHDGVLTDDLKIIKYYVRDSETGQYIEKKLDVDRHLYVLAKNYFSNPTTKIIPSISFDEDLPRLLTSLRLAHQKIKEQGLQNELPGYSNAVQKLGYEVANIQKNLTPGRAGITTGKSFGVKVQKAHELQSLSDKIIAIEDHEEAISFLENEFHGFAWDRPQYRLFTQNGKPNKLQISYALHKVASLKWPDNPPSSETIRAEILKPR